MNKNCLLNYKFNFYKNVENCLKI